MMDLDAWVRTMGIRPGGTVLLMADVTRMAWSCRRAPQGFDVRMPLNACLAAVGAEGHVLVPTFNFDLRDGDRFDVLHTRSISGALANAALAHPRFRRTPHPLHSFAVAGPQAPVLSEHDHHGSFDEGSPFAFLHREAAQLVAIDLPLNDTLTFVHYVEQREHVKYRRDRRIRIRYTDRHGATLLRSYGIFAKRKGYVNDFRALEPKLAEAGAMTDHVLERHRARVIDLNAAMPVIEHDIRHNAARSIHYFSLRGWTTEVLKDLLRTFGLRTAKERLAHAARIS